jgi:hypothetical protein
MLSFAKCHPQATIGIVTLPRTKTSVVKNAFPESDPRITENENRRFRKNFSTFFARAASESSATEKILLACLLKFYPLSHRHSQSLMPLWHIAAPLKVTVFAEPAGDDVQSRVPSDRRVVCRESVIISAIEDERLDVCHRHGAKHHRMSASVIAAIVSSLCVPMNCAMMSFTSD